MSGLTFDQAPRRVYWELTRACDLACRHCRAEARPSRAPDELATAECVHVLESLARSGPPAPHVVFTGGDPLKRPDLLELIREGARRGLDVALAPSATLAISSGAARALREAGVSAVSLSLDGSMAARHDAVRGVLGCYGWTLAAACHLVAAGIPLQINTLVTRETEPDLEAIAEVAQRLGAARWSLFFLIPVGRGRALTPLSAREAATTLGWLARQRGRWRFTVSTTEAPHFRRVMLDRLRAEGASPEDVRRSPLARSFGIRDGNGVMFIGANGDVTPSGFLPLVAGNVRDTDPVGIYRNDATFRALRAPDHFRGRCGRCGYRALCGGSRARAWATTGDALGEDPLCTWEVPALV